MINHPKIFALIFCCLCGTYSPGQTGPVQPIAATVEGRNVDSLAIWTPRKRENSLVLLTEKAGGSVMVFKGDSTAAFVRRFGNLARPNAVAVVRKVKTGRDRIRDLALVTERDGDRISVFSVPDFEKIAEFGTDIHQPMGISAVRLNKRELLVFAVAKRATGNDKIIRYRLSWPEGEFKAVRETQFGRELMPNEETVYADDRRRLVYAADETARNIKVYDFDGNLIKTFGDGFFEAQVEGIAVARCRRSDYLIAVDQLPTTEFEVFDLKDYRHAGTVLTAARRTDGIALTEKSLPGFPRGLFAAQSDPQDTGGLRAEFYDLSRILERAGVRSCR